MATAVSSSSAYKILIPVNRCNHFIAGCQGGSLSDYIRQVCEEVGRHPGDLNVTIQHALI